MRTVPHCGSNLSFKNTDKTEEGKIERKHEVKLIEKNGREAGVKEEEKVKDKYISFYYKTEVENTDT